MSQHSGWRCFHCGDVFRREVDAAEHFGGSLLDMAACQIKGHEHHLIAIIREQEQQLAKYRNEDGKILRAMEGMRFEHAEALRREEEVGYNRGVRDSLACVEVAQT